MIILLRQYKRLLICFISGLAIIVLLSWGTPNQQLASAFNQSQTTKVFTQPEASPTISDFAATHLEPNFYQY